MDPNTNPCPLCARNRDNWQLAAARVRLYDVALTRIALDALTPPHLRRIAWAAKRERIEA